MAASKTLLEGSTVYGWMYLVPLKFVLLIYKLFPWLIYKFQLRFNAAHFSSCYMCLAHLFPFLSLKFR